MVGTGQGDPIVMCKGRKILIIRDGCSGAITGDLFLLGLEMRVILLFLLSVTGLRIMIIMFKWS